jgi:protein TonB
MSLRCLLFVADEATADPIRQVLADLGVEGEHCAAAAEAVAKVTQESFQIVIVDWDAHEEAVLLLKTVRERKASQRPLTLAVVGEDSSVPQALQAGANSILRKPVLVNQAKDTLKTALNLLRAKETAAAHAAVAGASAASSLTSPAVPASAPHSVAPGGISGSETTLHAGEFLVSAPAPGRQFETESEIPLSGNQEPVEQVDALAELEPISAAAPKQKPAEEDFSAAPSAPSAPSSELDEPKGLQWHLKNRGIAVPAPSGLPAQSTPTSFPSASAASSKPEMVGFESMASDAPASAYNERSAELAASVPAFGAERKSAPPQKREQAKREEAKREETKEDAQLFAYVTGVGGGTRATSPENPEEEKSEATPRAPFRMGRGTILAAAALAVCAIVAAPQAPWHAKIRVLWGRGHQALHAWLNPQAVTSVAQAPVAHEDFARAGDEYKLPVAESIPDATTDPSQIKVTPVIDPTAKKNNNNDGSGANADQTGAPKDAAPGPGDPAPSASAPAQTPPASPDGQPANANPTAVAPAPGSTTGSAAVPAATTVPQISSSASHSESLAPQPAPVPKPSQIHAVSSSANPPIPSSLSSQMASMTPEASGNKAPETALPSIEPVSVPEATERGLLTDQPAIPYPANARSQQGTVILQVLVGRDGAVQDAKFMQGSLAFAHAAIDGVKQWKFKPYMMNGRPVSVATQMTMSFKPAP